MIFLRYIAILRISVSIIIDIEKLGINYLNFFTASCENTGINTSVICSC